MTTFKLTPGNGITVKELSLIETTRTRFHLPVLHLEDTERWSSLPVEERKHLTDDLQKTTCLDRCCDVEGLGGACCYLEPENPERVFGPIDETWIRTMLSTLRTKGVVLTRLDLVMDYDEGRVFADKWLSGKAREPFLNKENYPMLRLKVVGPRFACNWFSPTTRKCGIHNSRPDLCKSWWCEYIKGQFLVRTQEHPNRYQKLR